MKRVIAMYFSPTGTSGKITEGIAKSICSVPDQRLEVIDLTRPEKREVQYAFTENDILVLGYPVYAGRVPEVLQEVFHGLRGADTPVIIAAVYGNRDYEDALLEAQDILTEGGFEVIGAGAFIGEHSYSKKVGAGRPDESDLKLAADFGAEALKKLQQEGKRTQVTLKGKRPYKDPMPDMPFVPKAADACNDCGICAEVCPMGVIPKENPKVTENGCILCSACIKACPQEARHLDAEPIIKIRAMLESKFMERKEPELFL